MADIGHIATAYELEAVDQLKAIVVPHPKELLGTGNEGWEYPTIAPFAVGDRIYFQEKWCKGDWGTMFDDDIYFTKSTTPEAENIGWQPASTMPPQAAQYWFEIERVRIVQAKYVLYESMSKAGIYPERSSIVDPWREIQVKWNAAYPEQLWTLDRWIIGLDVKPVS